MQKLTQNKKIAISAVALFVVSFSVMVFFLGEGQFIPEEGKTNVVEAEKGGHGGEVKTEKPTSTEAIFVTNVEGLIQYSSPIFCSLIEKDCDDLKEVKLFDYVNNEDLPDLASTFGKLVQNGEKMEGIGPIRMLCGKKQKLLLLNAQPEMNDKGKVDSIRFSAKDITSKVENLGEKGQPKETTEDSKEATPRNWLERLYPKIQDMNQQSNKLLVKISFKAESK